MTEEKITKIDEINITKGEIIMCILALLLALINIILVYPFLTEFWEQLHPIPGLCFVLW